MRPLLFIKATKNKLINYSTPEIFLRDNYLQLLYKIKESTIYVTIRKEYQYIKLLIYFFFLNINESEAYKKRSTYLYKIISFVTSITLLSTCLLTDLTEFIGNNKFLWCHNCPSLFVLPDYSVHWIRRSPVCMASASGFFRTVISGVAVGRRVCCCWSLGWTASLFSYRLGKGTGFDSRNSFSVIIERFLESSPTVRDCNFKWFLNSDRNK